MVVKEVLEKMLVKNQKERISLLRAKEALLSLIL